jgi:rod shape-determining protein MreC
MESLITRYRNVSILVAILFAQVLGLAVQVRRSPDSESTRLIRVWAVAAVTPFEKAIVWTQSSFSNLWRGYIYLRGVRQENRNLKYEIENLRLKQVRLSEDAEQARRLQALLGFKEQFILKTVAAQVIGFSGSDLSRAVYIDKGDNDGIGRDMAVITADGVVGKVLRVYKTVSLVLLIDDQTSGVGAVLAKSRLQGILRGTPSGEVVLEKILSDEQVEPGEQVLTSGGDQIFPKGLPAGTVASVSQGPESFLNIRIRPAARLSKLEEVLVITQQEEEMPVADWAAPTRAADVLAQRLPSVPDRPAESASQSPTPDGATRPSGTPAGANQSGMKQSGTNQAGVKPAGANQQAGAKQNRSESPSAAAEEPSGTPKTAPSAVKAPRHATRPAAPASTPESAEPRPESAPPGNPPQ